MPAESALALAPAAPQSRAALPPPAPVLARIARGGPAALDDHELLALLGIAVDARTLAAAGGSGDSSTTPTISGAPSSFPPRTAPAFTRSSTCTPAGWRPGSSATAGRLPRRPTRGATSRRGSGATATRCSRCSTWTTATASSRSRRPSPARSTARPSIRASSCAGRSMHNAAACIAAHSHPSGVAEPSSADRAITKRLLDALALVDDPPHRPLRRRRRRAGRRSPSAASFERHRTRLPPSPRRGKPGEGECRSRREGAAPSSPGGTAT